MMHYNSNARYAIARNAFIIKNCKAINYIQRNLFRDGVKKHEEILWINNPVNKLYSSMLFAHYKPILGNTPIFISRCNSELASFFQDKGFETIKLGKEAMLRLDYPHFQKKSLRELINAGLKKASVKELGYSEETCDLLELFKTKCTHANKPQLKYLFNDVYLPSNRLFVIQDNEKNWLGAITIAKGQNIEIKTDLLLRKCNAPRGTMEGLIYSIFNILKEEGYKYWSLGEVPYIVYDSPFFSKEFFLNFTGRKLNFAYNYTGLYNFKNKFNPFWRETYICGKPNLGILTLLSAAFLSNLVSLIINRAVF